MNWIVRVRVTGIIFLFFIFLAGCSEKTEDLPDSVRDVDGNIYSTIKMGNQVWMAENLRVTRYRNGARIPLLTTNTEWSGARTGLCTDYEFLEDPIRGRLYNWNAVRGDDDHILAPEGWHIPTQYEWQELVEYLGGDPIAGGMMKDTLFWSPVNFPKESVSGFKAVPTGYRDPYGVFRGRDTETYFWTSSPETSYSSIILIIFDLSDNTQFFGTSRTNGFSVRCVKD